MPRKNIQLMGMMGPVSTITADKLEDTTYKGASTKYPLYVNGYFEVVTDRDEPHRKIGFVKRFGLHGAVDEGISALSISTTYNGYKIQGVTSSLDKTRLLFFMNNGVTNRTAYFDGTTLTVSAGAAPAAAGNWTYTGPVVWTVLDGISYGANVYYAVTDFTKGAVVNATGTWTEITDADFTGLSKVTNLVGLDGYLFVGTSNNRIYNSDLNAATSWTATSFLTAADTPGSLLWLGRIKNYLIAFKQYSIEFFEDTGNPTPGSPLTAQKALRKPIGLVSPSSVQYVSDGIIFMGMSEKSRIGIYKIRYDDLGLELVSDYGVNQLLGLSNLYTTATTYSADSVAASTAIGQSQVCTYGGKELYIINLSGVTALTPRTLVYDNALKVWVMWDTWYASSGAATTGRFDVSQCVQFCLASLGFTFQLFVNNYIGSVGGTAPFFMAAASTTAGNGAYDQTAQTGGSNRTFPWVWMSDMFDFGTRARKVMDTLEFLMESGGTSSSITLVLYHRNSSWNVTATQGPSTRTRTFKVDNTADRMIFRQLGPFRAKQVGFKEESVLPLRMTAVETQLNVGEQDQDS